MTFTYRIAKGLAATVDLIGFRVKAFGRDNLNNKGRCMIVSNHVMWWDPVVLGGLFKEQVHYMAKAELFKNKIVRFFLTKIGAFPVERGEADFNALKKSFQILREDKCLGIFPEGTRMKEDLGEFQKGAAAIALKTDATIIPVYIDGPYKMFKQRCRLVVGKAFDLKDRVNPKDKDAIEKGTEILKNEVAKLRKWIKQRS